jgi:hypothetical protein
MVARQSFRVPSCEAVVAGARARRAVSLLSWQQVLIGEEVVMHRLARPASSLATGARLPAAVAATVLLVACSGHSPPARPATGGAAAAVASEPVAVEAATAAEPVSSTATGEECPPTPPDSLCPNGRCSNTPFVPTACWTTDYGPASADVFLATSNFLYCEEGTYALCFFSGPPAPTGKPTHVDENNALPCQLAEGGGVADCTCQLYTSGGYFVDVNAILNLGAWYETVAACGPTGSGCKNMDACGRDPQPDSCPGLPFAPVCRYVRDQNAQDPSKSLIPGADLISAFSFAMEDGYLYGSSKCPSGRYAGCMTAPCRFAESNSTPPADGDLVQCACPTYSGDFQIGQFRERDDCTIDGAYVWSAANRIKD